MRYVGQRLIQFVLVFVIVTFMVLAATRIGSTDPARDLAGGAVSEAQIEQVKEDYPYLDKPLAVQYVYWLKDIVTGDWGRSYVASQSVVDMFQQRMPTTVFIVFWAIVIGLLIAVPLGVYSAYRRDGLFDQGGSIGSFAVISMPPLVVGRAAALPRRHARSTSSRPSGARVRRAVEQPGRALQELLHPGADARRRPRGDLEPAAAGRHDPRPAERLHQHGPRQGHLAAPRAVGARPAHVGAVADDQRRPADGGADRRRRHRRAVLRAEGHRRPAARSPSSRTTCS